MAITQTVEKKTDNGINMLIHRCECGEATQYFRPVCENCDTAYWRTYSRLY